MNESTVDTARSTGAMHPIRPPPRTEEEVLEREANYAEQGLVMALKDVGCDVIDAIDLTQHTRRHPFRALAIAAGAGFLLHGRMRAMLRGEKGSLAGALLFLTPIAKLIQTSVIDTLFTRISRTLFKR